MPLSAKLRRYRYVLRLLDAVALLQERVTDACARVSAAQRVMRYVCHELRNPLHGLMVRDAVSRGAGVAGVSLSHSPCGRVCWKACMPT